MIGGALTEFRGGTIQWATFFYDFDGVTVVTPASAFVNISYLDTTGATQTVLIPMVNPGNPALRWTAQWDSRGVDPGPVAWSIHSSGSTVAVEDGAFTLTANQANLPTFA